MEETILPYGSSSVLSGLSETFAFHSSPENFITSRVLALRKQHADIAESRIPIRATVLNRNVAVISSYRHVQQLLCDQAVKLSASKAYDELMAPFFPPPNLLLADPPRHASMKDDWQGRMESATSSASGMARNITLIHFREVDTDQPIDLYQSMKDLAWKLLITLFLSDGTDSIPTIEQHARLIQLQETLLRGQFSLLPVSINLLGWSSPRAKGLAARKELQRLLKSKIEEPVAQCPFSGAAEQEKKDVASHLLLFTSSLAVKAMASLLTAVILNVFARDRGDSRMIDGLRATADPKPRRDLIYYIVLETERLSPPVVGIMRRTEEDIILDSLDANSSKTRIPKGWDTWIYFVGAARDPTVFDQSSETFRPDRYASSGPPPEGLAFGIGPKTCLGQQTVRNTLVSVIDALSSVSNEGGSAEPNIDIECQRQDLSAGVQGWLGMQTGTTPEDWARDMKQLPTQHPKNPIMVKVAKSIPS